MSTVSTIAIKEGDLVRGIYCEYDGYISHVGYILQNYFTNIDKISKLISLGDIKSLGNHLEAAIELPNNYEADTVRRYTYHISEFFTMSYLRDLGEEPDEDNQGYCVHVNEWLEKYAVTYNYVYDMETGRWNVIYVDFERNKGTVKRRVYRKDYLSAVLKDKEHLYRLLQDREESSESEFECIQKKKNMEPVINIYNEVLKRYNITDIEFGYSKDEFGNRVFAIYNVLQPGQNKRKSVAKHKYIQVLMKLIDDKYQAGMLR